MDKLRKMPNLVWNECIKAFSKISTKIMLIALVVLSLGFNFVMFMQQQQNEKYIQQSMEDQIDYDQQIRDANEIKYRGWEEEVARLEFLRDNGIKSTEVWKQEAVSEMLNAQANSENNTQMKTLAEKYEQSIKNNSWVDYYNIKKQVMESEEYSSEEEKQAMMWEVNTRIKYNVEPQDLSTGGWKNQVIYNTYDAQIQLASILAMEPSERDQKSVDALEEKVLVGEYRLSNNIEEAIDEDNTSLYGSSINFWGAFTNSAKLITVISILIIIVAGGIISSEFSAGTIKFLLINPVKRWKIFASKYITLIIISAVMLVLFYVFNGILAGVFFGFGSAGAPYLSAVNGAIQAGSGWAFVGSKYLLGSVSLIVMATFSFMISSLVRNSALSIALGVAFVLSGNGIVLILGQAMRMDWARYLIFANTDLSSIIERSTPFLGQTLTFALIVISVYMVVFLLAAWDGFMRRDVR